MNFWNIIRSGSENMKFGREFDVPSKEKMEKLADTARGILPNVRYSV